MLKKYSPLFPYLFLIILNAFAWYPVLNFWFFRAWEQSWLIGVCGYNFTIVCLMRGHGFLYLVNYLLFGWNPTGWYLTAIILHTIAVLLIFRFTNFLVHNRVFAFIVALLFSISIAHNDVVNWGSFEGLYALMMIVFLSGIFCYLRFKKEKTNKRYIWYFLTIMIFLFGLFVRESAILLPIFLVLTEMFLLFNTGGIDKNVAKKTKQQKTQAKNDIDILYTYVRSYLPAMVPFFLLIIVYLLFRSWYGGAPHDQVDAMVQLRGALITQGKYGEYIWRGLLALGKFAAVHIIPYPLANIVRDKLFAHFPDQSINLYLFPLVGFAYMLVQIVLIGIFWKKRTVRNILLFSFAWFVIPTIFFSFAFSITDYMLAGAYQWDSSRWRYFALFGTLVFWVTVCYTVYELVIQKRLISRIAAMRIGLSLVAIYAAINFGLLRTIQNEMYFTTFKPPREFYTTFLKEFKTLPKEYIFYTYPFASPLNDFMSEWYYLRKTYYSYLSAERGREFSEGQLSMVLERFKNHTADPEKTFYLDYNPRDGLLNNTSVVRKILASQKEDLYSIDTSVTSLPFASLQKMKKHQIDIALKNPIHVETPYEYEVTLSGTPSNIQENDERLSSYARDREDFLKNMRVNVCKTAPVGSAGTAADYLLPKHMIDGNFGRRSLWVADCKPAWLLLDLSAEKKIGGIAFYTGDNATNIPFDYSIETSTDAHTWRQAANIKGNTSIQRIHLFENAISARYIRITVTQTTEGQMTMLDEVEPINENDVSLAREYRDDFRKLVHNSYDYGTGIMRFFWETEPNNWQPEETIDKNSFYVPFTLDGSQQTVLIEPNENEYYSTSEQFLKRMITKLHVDFTGQPGEIYVESVKVKPKYSVK
jgi:hypothetical protein